jgi:hypothetical protein
MSRRETEIPALDGYDAEEGSIMKTGLTFGMIMVMTLFPFVPTARAKPQLHVDPDNKTCEIELDPSLTQDQFHGFIKELSSIGAFKQAASTEPLGKYVFDFGLEIAYTPVNDAAARWNNTFTHPDDQHYLFDIMLVKFRASMGITDRLDGGLYVSTVPQSNVTLLGVDFKYAFDKWRTIGTAARFHYTKMLQTHDVHLDIVGLDVSAAKSFGPITPYIGAGGFYSAGRENSSKVQLHNEDILQPHEFVGADLRLYSFKLGFEAEYGSVPTYTLKVLYEI